MFWNRARTAPTPSEAARILSEEARAQKARRTAMLDILRGCVARGDVAKLGWRS
jgi:hypothetical protein